MFQVIETSASRFWRETKRGNVLLLVTTLAEILPLLRVLMLRLFFSLLCPVVAR
jgi:hypothetical protein